MNRFCFQLADGREICIDIPMLIVKFPPVPDPLDPWSQIQRIDTIERLAATLESDIGRELHAASRDALARSVEAELGGRLSEGRTSA